MEHAMADLLTSNSLDSKHEQNTHEQPTIFPVTSKIYLALVGYKSFRTKQENVGCF